MVQIGPAFTELYSSLGDHGKLSQAFSFIAIAPEPIQLAQTKPLMGFITSNAKEKGLA